MKMLFIAKNLWMPVIVFTLTHICAMSHSEQTGMNSDVYNQLDLPSDLMLLIFSQSDLIKDNKYYDKISLLDFISRFIKLKSVSNYYFSLITLTVIGKACACYTIEERNVLLAEVTRTISTTNYATKSSLVFVLIESGANANSGVYSYNLNRIAWYGDYSLLHKALIKKDIPLLTLLFEHKADPNQMHPKGYPLFFESPTVDIAELFYKYGARLDGKNMNGDNVLLSRVHALSPDLITFYIKHKVDPRFISPLTQRSLLHALADINFTHIFNGKSKYLIEKCVLLMTIIPDMINTLDNNGNTPIDLVKMKKGLKFFKENRRYVPLLDDFFMLCRNNGGKTAQELNNNRGLL